jgi:hypothetical protein
MVVGVVLVGGVGGTWVTMRAWRGEADARAPIVAALADVPADDRIMSPDAGAYRYHAGRPGIVTPDDPLPVVHDALTRYGIRWLVLERDHITPSLAPLLAGTERPSWLGEPVVVVPAPSEPRATASVVGGVPLPRAALYPVCLTQGDARCQP